MSNAKIVVGARGAAHVLHGDVRQRGQGTDIHYDLTMEGPRWLVCQYGGTGSEDSAIAGPEVAGVLEVWYPLAPTVDDCDLAITADTLHTIDTIRYGRAGAWMAVARCDVKRPPPPDMMQRGPLGS